MCHIHVSDTRIRCAEVFGRLCGGGGATASASSTPSFELFGQANDFNNVESAQSQDTTPMITVQAVVSESEVTGVQNKVAKMQKNAEL